MSASRILLAVSVLACGARGAFPQASGIDLGGEWINDQGAEVLIVQKGANVSARFVSVDFQPRGFNNGDLAFYGQISGRQLDVMQDFRFVLSWKKACPREWESWTRVIYALSESGDHLSGQWTQKNIRPDCSEYDGPLLTSSWERVVETLPELTPEEAEDSRAKSPPRPMPVAHRPAAIAIVPGQESVGIHKPIHLDIGLIDEAGETVFADRPYDITLRWVNGEVKPDKVNIPKGGTQAVAYWRPDHSGDGSITATTEGLKSGSEIVTGCDADPIKEFVLVSTRATALALRGDPLRLTIKFVSDRGSVTKGFSSCSKLVFST